MDSIFPSVTKGANHFGFGGEVFVFFVFDIALVDEGLEVAAVFDSIGGVHINALHFPRHCLFLQEGVHDEQGIPGDESVGPIFVVLVKFQFLFESEFFVGGFEERGLSVSIFAEGCANDDGGVYALVDMERLDRDIGGGLLLSSGPLELGMKVVVVLAGLRDSGGVVGGRDCGGCGSFGIFVRDSGVRDVGSLFLMAISADFDGGLFGGSFFGGLFSGALVESCGGHCSVFSSLGGVGLGRGDYSENSREFSSFCKYPGATDLGRWRTYTLPQRDSR